ncbi:hypothetical protein PSPO01_16345 [Paraphaeosphaeria sporulosa]
MDLFAFHSRYQVLVCKPCGYAVAPSCLAGRVQTKHPDACRDAGLPYTRPRKPASRLAKRLQEEYDLLDPTVCSVPIPRPAEPPVPDLKPCRGCKGTRCEHVLPEGKRA